MSTYLFKFTLMTTAEQNVKAVAAAQMQLADTMLALEKVTGLKVERIEINREDFKGGRSILRMPIIFLTHA